MSPSTNSFVLTIVCPDTVGIVAAVSGYLSDQDCFIEASNHYGDPNTHQFFMRTRFTPIDDAFSRAQFADRFVPIAEKFAMQIQLFDQSIRSRVLIDADTKPEAEKHLLQIVDDTNTDLIVLARYMQVLSDELCRKMTGRMINIHHSFLPGFKGARPYHQAHEHGVKLIGATAHYVSSKLDEGPIIEQQVERVDHSQSIDELVAAGKDVENLTLARAVGLHIDHRVFLNGNKTVVFR